MTDKMRALDTATLDEAAKFRAGEFIRPSVFSVRSPKIATMGRAWVLQGLYRLPFGDEFDYLVPAIKGWMGPSARASPRLCAMLTPAREWKFTILRSGSLLLVRGTRVKSVVSTVP